MLSGPESERKLEEIPPEHRIRRIYCLPRDSAADFAAELEDETEEPTASLRGLLRRTMSDHRSVSGHPATSGDDD